VSSQKIGIKRFLSGSDYRPPIKKGEDKNPNTDWSRKGLGEGL
jgi:hypothetical protein